MILMMVQISHTWEYEYPLTPFQPTYPDLQALNLYGNEKGPQIYFIHAPAFEKKTNRIFSTWFGWIQMK